MEIPMPSRVIGKDKKTIFDILTKIQELKKDRKEIPEKLYLGIPDLENVVMDVSGSSGFVTVLLTDYKARMKELRTKFDNYNGEVDSYIGRKTGNADNNLKYLVCSTSSMRGKWNSIAKSYRESFKSDYSAFMNVAAKLGRVTELLAWWIARPCFSDTLYDDLFACTDNKYQGGFEKLCDEYETMVKGVADATGSESALNEYCEKALKIYESALVHKNDPKGKAANMERRLNDFWNPKSHAGSLDYKFKLLELYKDSQEPNFLVEVVYPQVKSVKKAAFGVLTYLSKPIVLQMVSGFGIRCQVT